ncbi:MAG: hypothetical protein Q8P41_05115, partial [Pseudomonadota bacterium]|nr:hypothetical protein [Pseudomonadota bacterium]
MLDLAHRVRTFGGWADVEALLGAYARAGGAAVARGATTGPDAPVDIAAPAAGLAGQTGIRMREALVTGEAHAAASLALALDER